MRNKEENLVYMREYRKRNPEKIRALNKKAKAKKKAKDPAKFSASESARYKLYCERLKATMTPEEKARKAAAHRVRNKKWRSKKGRAYARNKANATYWKNPEKGRRRGVIAAEKRRCRMNGRGVTQHEWTMVKQNYGNRCAWCRCADKPLAMDHIVAVSKGGVHDYTNICPSCKSCNSAKRDRDWGMPIQIGA